MSRNIKGHKSTKAELIKRIDKVDEWLCDGFSRREILQNASKENWNLSDREVDQYIADVKTQWEAESQKDRPHYLQEAIKFRKRLILRCLAKGDMSTASRTRDALDKILGIYVEHVENRNYNTYIRDYSKLSDEQLETVRQKENEVEKIIQEAEKGGA